MIRFINILLILLVFTNTKAQQNLLHNGDFEDTVSCPVNMGGDIEKARYWTSPMVTYDNRHTSDFYHLCSSHYHTHFITSIMPYSGSGFAGIILFPLNIIPNNEYREYIEGLLKEPLIKDKKYCIELYIRPNDFDKYLIDEFQIYFSSNILKTDSLASVIKNVNPQVKFDIRNVNDTVWTMVSSTFIASGTEKYVTIGNFKTNNQTVHHTVNWGHTPSHYYFDDIKIYYCGPDTTPPPTTDSLIIPNVFTPNGDGFNDKFAYKNQEQWEFETQIFNRWGNLVFDNKSSENWDGTYQGERASSGVYFYVIKAVAIKTGEVKIYKGTVTVMY